MFKRFIRNENGNVAIFGALLVLPLLMMIGVSVDYTRIETAKGEILTSVDNAANSPQMMMSDIPGAEKSLSDFINANTGRDTAQVQISIFQDKLRIDASDTIDTPLLSVIGQAETQIVVRLEFDAPTSTGSATNVSLRKSDEKKIARKGAVSSRQQINALKRYERSLRRSLLRLNTKRSNLPAEYKNRLRARLQKQLREVKRQIRNAQVR